jgi:hypothetical protein
MQECLSEPDSFEHSLRIGSEAFMGALSEINSLEEFSDPLLEDISMHTVEFPMEFQEFFPGEVFIEIGAFWHETDMSESFTREWSTMNHTISRFWFDETEDYFHQGCLPRAIRSEKSENTSRLDRERNILKDRFFPDPFRDMREENSR